MNARKIATSVPSAQYEALERVRKRLRLRRSQAIQEALALWLASRERDERVEHYIRGYVNHPDDAREARAFAKAWATGVEPEEW